MFKLESKKKITVLRNSDLAEGFFQFFDYGPDTQLAVGFDVVHVDAGADNPVPWPEQFDIRQFAF